MEGRAFDVLAKAFSDDGTVQSLWCLVFYSDVKFLFVGENIVNVLQESRVVQLNKMLGLPPSALPPHDEVDIREIADLVA